MEYNVIDDNLMFKLSRLQSIRITQILKMTSIILFITLSQFNFFRYGVGLSGLIIPIILIILYIVVIKMEKLKLDFIHLLSMIMLIFMILSSLSSLNSSLTRTIITYSIFYISYVLFTSINYTKNQIKGIVFVYELMGVISSILILYNVLNNNFYGWQRFSISILGVQRDPNYVTALIIPAFSMIMWNVLFCKKSKFTTAIRIFALLLILFGIYYTGSRSAMLSIFLISGGIILFYVVKKRIFLQSIIPMFVIGAIVLVIVQVIDENAFLYNRLFSVESYISDIRLTLWKEAIKLFELRPIVGSGIEAANTYLTGLGYHNSHNLFLDILINQGLIGISILLAIFFNFTRVNCNKAFIIIITFSFYAPLFFINGFNTAVYWLPFIILHIFYKYSQSTYETKGNVI